MTQAKHEPPRHIVSAAGYITNAVGEVLLVRTYLRGHTWELPGGQVEEGEDLLTALAREVREETGIEIRAQGVTGVYNNVGRGIVNVVLRGEAVGGLLQTSDETQEVGFFALDEGTVERLVQEPYLRSRILDAMRAVTLAPCETFRTRPYELVQRVAEP